MIIVVMGPSGSGKTTIGRLLATELAWSFVDADDLHTPACVAKMRLGEPLTDSDRQPWLARLRELVSTHLQRNEPMVLACSALKQSYREALCYNHPEVRFVVLRVPVSVLHTRLQAREGHFMPASLLPSQLAVFEDSDNLTAVDASAAPPHVVQEILEKLRLVKHAPPPAADT